VVARFADLGTSQILKFVQTFSQQHHVRIPKATTTSLIKRASNHSRACRPLRAMVVELGEMADMADFEVHAHIKFLSTLQTC
jgi:hypothetical protein